MDARALALSGVILLGRVLGVTDGKFALADDLEVNFARADNSAREFTKLIDEYVRKTGMEAQREEDADKAMATAPALAQSRSSLDLKAAGVTTVIWCTGYQFDFGWVPLPVFNNRGIPLQTRGVTNTSGAYFLGFHWMHKYTSGTLFGVVGEDAAYLAERIATR